MRLERIDILVVSISSRGSGGIQRFSRELLRAGHLGGLVTRSLDVARRGPTPSRRDRIAAILNLVVLIVRARPRMVVLTHVNLAPLGYLLAALKSEFVVVLHGRESWKVFGGSTLAALKCGRAVWAVSDYTANAFRARNPSALEGEIKKVPLTTRFGVSTAKPTVAGPEVLCVARLVRSERYKGVDHLIEAWPQVLNRCPEARLRIVGDGDDKPYLQALVGASAIEASVEFVGSVSDAELQRLYSTSSCFALPGRLESSENGQEHGEGLGIVFLEASGFGLPVVVGTSGGSPEALLSGETGFLVGGREGDELASAVCRLLEDESLRQQMGDAGRAFVTARHSIDALASFLRDQVSSRRMSERKSVVTVSAAEAARRWCSHIWQHPSNSGRRVRQFARSVTFQLRARLTRRPQIVPLGRSNVVLADRRFKASTLAVYGNPPHPDEMSVWRRWLREGDVFFDVGANVGVYTILVSELGAQVEAFEPDGSTYETLVANLNLNGLQARPHRVALGASEGIAELTEGLDSKNHILDSGVGLVGQKVEVKTLDGVLGDRVLRGLKIDVEGAELSVLEGARRSLSEGRVCLIQLEFNRSVAGGPELDGRDPLRQLLATYAMNIYEVADGKLVEFHGSVSDTDVFACSSDVAAEVNADASNRRV